MEDLNMEKGNHLRAAKFFRLIYKRYSFVITYHKKNELFVSLIITNPFEGISVINHIL